MDFRNIIAEPPYDEMGNEFAGTFGKFLNETSVDMDADLTTLAYRLFQLRLNLAEKYNTFFAKQVGVTWLSRFNGFRPEGCYSFAMPQLVRTFRFYNWCEQSKNEPNKGLFDWWGLPRPELPFGPHNSPEVCGAWHYEYKHFRFTRMLYADRTWLFVHPTGNDVHELRVEAERHWKRALTPNTSLRVRVDALATFEWLWFWTNPFGRAGALTGDALSLLVQKKLQVSIRPGFYHQDCEALLMNLDDYVAKRANDMLNGFVPKFAM